MSSDESYSRAVEEASQWSWRHHNTGARPPGTAKLTISQKHAVKYLKPTVNQSLMRYMRRWTPACSSKIYLVLFIFCSRGVRKQQLQLLTQPWNLALTLNQHFCGGYVHLRIQNNALKNLCYWQLWNIMSMHLHQWASRAKTMHHPTLPNASVPLKQNAYE